MMSRKKQKSIARPRPELRSQHVLDVPVIGQLTAYECGNTCLAAVVQYHGRAYSAADLKALAKTKSTGTDHQNMIDGALATGAHVFAKAGGSIKDLVHFIKRGQPVIVGWWAMWPKPKRGDGCDQDFSETWTTKKMRADNDCGHYSVLRGVTDTSLLFMDPQDGYSGKTIGYCEWSDAEFDRVWYDTDTADYVPVDRWYMVLDYDPETAAKHPKGGKLFSPA
jgi:predicted double-glycine peptidase